MTEQQIDRDRLRASAESALACGTFDEDVLSAVPALLDALDQAEAELDSWMTRAYEAEKRAWRAEARIKAVRELHVPDRPLDKYPDCAECAIHGYCEDDAPVEWPCPTIRALDG